MEKRKKGKKGLRGAAWKEHPPFHTTRVEGRRGNRGDGGEEGTPSLPEGEEEGEEGEECVPVCVGVVPVCVGVVPVCVGVLELGLVALHLLGRLKQAPYTAEEKEKGGRVDRMEETAILASLEIPQDRTC